MKGIKRKMAQLIKLQNYVSRYQQDVYHYPSQFVRMKKQQWHKFVNYSEMQKHDGFAQTEIMIHENDSKEKNSMLHKLKNLFRKRDFSIDEGEMEKKESPFLPINLSSMSEKELKQFFLDRLFESQIKWASSTLTETSYIDYKYFYDERLKYCLQRFPDTFLVMYEPILSLKKAPVELDVVLLTPTELWCLTFLEEETEAVYYGSSDRFWVKKVGKKEKKVLSPVISLRRMEIIVSRLLRLSNVDFPVKKAVLSRNSYIEYPSHPFDLHILDKKSYPKWFLSMRNLSSPLKMMQLKAAKTLLEFAETKSVQRPEWDDEVEWQSPENGEKAEDTTL